MMKALLSVRFRALFDGLTAQARQKKKSSPGMVILFIILYAYLLAVICGMTGFTFFSLAEPYHAAGLDWFYFSVSGLMALGFSVLGSVFTTQSQLYDAKDNPLLLSMPVPPQKILLSRMIPLLAMNLLFSGLVILPAAVVYAFVVTFSPAYLLAQLAGWFAVAILSQAIACLLGWLLHLMLMRMNKSLASLLYLVIFMAAYFYIYSQAGDILNTFVSAGDRIAAAVQTWVWPLYALGCGSTGSLPHLLGTIACAAVCFTAVWLVLSATFLRTASVQRSSKRRALTLGTANTATPTGAIISKELRKFLSSPVYLTNMGIGILMNAALTVAGIVLKDDILSLLTLLPGLSDYIPLLICAVICYMSSTICISTPSVSLEGKSIWILKSLPISSGEILLSKFRFHCLLAVPSSGLCGMVLAIAYGCSVADTLLCAVVPGMLAVLCGLIGMVTGLRWARLDYISEAYPCKQSMALVVTMFSMMGVPLVFGLLYALVLMPYISPTVFLVVCAALLASASFGFYRLMLSWGVKKWDSL